MWTIFPDHQDPPSECPHLRGHLSHQPPPPCATTEVLTHAIKKARKRAVLTLSSDAVGERELRWGKEIDIREITAFGDDELTDQKVAAYVAKYATKSAEDSGTVDRSLFCHPCSGRGYTTGPDGFRDLCQDWRRHRTSRTTP
jgi:hypothetical protein